MKKAFIQLHIAVLLAGFTAILGKLIQINEGYLVLYRMAISSLTLFILLSITRELIRIKLADVLKLFGIGAIISLHWVSFYGSIKYSNVSVAVTCFSAVGFFTSFIDPLINRRKIDPVEVFLGLLTIAGVYLIFNFYPEFKMGILFGIVSAMLASIFPILNKRVLENFTPKIVTFYEMTGGVVALLFILPVYLQFFPASYALPTASDWFWLLILAWACTVLAFILSLQALKKVSAFTSNLTFNFEPIYSIIMAFIIFKEGRFLGMGFYLGFSLILLAVSLQMVRVYQEQRIIGGRKKFWQPSSGKP